MQRLPYNSKLREFSQELRRNMTQAERLLWSRLRKRQPKGLQVYRQRIIGEYIVDFYCPKSRLVIEVDGGQHFTDGGREGDQIRDKYLNSLGLRVLRFSDREVFENLEGVMGRVFENL